MTDVEIMFLC